MELNLSTEHSDRVNHLVTCFREATEEIAAALVRASEEAAQFCPQGEVGQRHRLVITWV